MRKYKNKVESISPLCCVCNGKAVSVLPKLPEYLHDKKGRMIGGSYGFDSFCEKHQHGRHMPIGVVLMNVVGIN